MKLIKLETKDQFFQLKKRDLVIVQWNNNDIAVYKIYGLVDYDLVLCKRRNYFIAIDMYLQGKSKAKEAWLIKGE